jgi:protein-tyrosine-phosphatase
MTTKHDASSAGTSVVEEDKEGWPPGKRTAAVLSELGYDISLWKRKQVTREMVQRADKVIVLMQREEAEQYVPDYIKSSGKAEYWDIEDMRERDVPFHRARLNEIRILVIDLVKKLG